MKRFLTATALTALIATGATAQTAAEMTQINSYLPNVDASMLSETEIQTLLSIANNGESETEKRQQMQAVVEDANMISTEVSEAQLAQLQLYAPETDFSTFTAEDMVEAVAIMNSGQSETEVAMRLQNFDSGRTLVMTDQITRSELVALNAYLPATDLSLLTDDELERMAAIINSDEDFPRRKLLEIVEGN